MNLLLAALVTCGFQGPAETQCLDLSGHVRAVTGDDRRYALIRKVICARPETGPDMDVEDPALLIFWDDGESREDAMVDLADERAGGCNS
jgi:hypothetical protein